LILSGLFSKKSSFLNSTKPEIVKEFRQRFLKVSLIMNCIICEKCKLWGKIQTLGIGTCLKILFALETKRRWERLHLKTSEIIALLNTFARISESIEIIRSFRSESNKEANNLMMFLFLLFPLTLILPPLKFSNLFPNGFAEAKNKTCRIFM
jgi:hypothetical protein